MDDIFDPPKGFQLVQQDDPPVFDPPKGFQIETPPAQQPQQQGGGWRGMIDQLNPIGTAEARGARAPTTHPSPGPEPAGSPPIGTRQQQPDGTFKSYIGGGQWQEGEYKPPEKEGKPAKRTITPSEYQKYLWAETAKKAGDKGPQNVPPWTTQEGSVNWDRMTDPKYGVFPFNLKSINEDLTKENLGRIHAATEDINKAKRGETGPAGLGPAARLGLGGLGYAFQAPEALARSIAGQPLENTLGIPKEYTDTAAMLGIPGIGLPRTAAMSARPLARSQYRTLQKEAAIDPLNVTPTSPAGSKGYLTPQEQFKQYIGDMKQKPSVPGYSPEGSVLKGAQAIEKVFSPETSSNTAQDAVALFRDWGGLSARETEKAKDLFTRGDMFGGNASWIKEVERAGDQAVPNSAYTHIPGWNQKDEMAAYIDGAPKATRPEGRLGDIADMTRDTIKKASVEFKNLPENEQKAFRENWLQHTWKNWKESGSGASTSEAHGGPGTPGAKVHERSDFARDYAEGRRNGLIPAFDNPLDQAMNSIADMNRAITGSKVFNGGLDAGTVRTAEGKGVEALKENGYAELTGRPGHFAPEGWARIWNNYYSSGAPGVWGQGLETMRKVTNLNTQLLLGLSMYHGFTMGEATMGTQFGRAMKMAGAGEYWRAAKAAGEVPFAPLTYFGRGQQAQLMYLDHMQGSPQAKKAIEFLTRGGWRPMGKQGIDATADIAVSRMGSFSHSLQRGTLGKDLMAGKVLGNLGRVIDTINEPLFSTYIPRVKAGANMKRMEDFLRQNPNASEREYLDAARRIVDETDNSFGEMVQDNIMWSKGLKQIGMAAMLSYSWNMGGARQWGGGVRDMARWGMGQQALSPKAQYVMGSTMTWAMMNTFAHRLHTGKWPWDEHTLTDPDGKPHQVDPMSAIMGGFYTGGWTQVWKPPPPEEAGKPFAKGSYEWQPEKGRVPGYMKDMIAYTHDPAAEFGHKYHPGARTAVELATGKDWKGQPYREPRQMNKLMDQVPRWLQQSWEHVVDNAMPITLQNMGLGRRDTNPRTGLNTPEVMLGMQPAQSVIQNPYTDVTRQHFDQQEYDKAKRYEDSRKKRMEQQRERMQKEKSQYGGPQ
jgi:hypothetical protein